MKFVLYLLLAFSAVTMVSAQAKPTTAADYDGVLRYAVSETNQAFPFIFTAVIERFVRGKLVSTETLINERQSEGVERGTEILTSGGQTLRSYSIMLGFDSQTYCSKDGKTWNGPQQYVCPGPDGSNIMGLYGAKEPIKAEYSVSEKTLNGKPVKVYRKYAVYRASSAKGKDDFEEEIATIDSRGFFISVIKTEGTLDPEIITMIGRQTWDFNTKFKAVVAPK